MKAVSTNATHSSSSRTAKPKVPDRSKELGPAPAIRSAGAGESRPNKILDGGRADVRRQRIDFLGPDPLPVIQTLRVLHEVGDGFAESLKSLRQVSTLLEDRSSRGCYPNDLPYGTSSLSRYCQAAEEYFGRHYDLAGKAELFIRKGPGQSIVGLTDLGVEAWAHTREFLIRHGVVDDNE